MCGDTCVERFSRPRVEAAAPLGIVIDKQNGDRNDYIGTSFDQSCYRFIRVRFRKDDQRHDRMTENFDPPLESDEGKIGPGNGNETVEQKSDEPTVVVNDFGKTDLSLSEDAKARYNQHDAK